MRKLAGTLLAVVISVVGVVGLIAFFNARDRSTTINTSTSPPAAAGPGAPLTAAGNVVLRYASPGDRAALQRLAADLGAPDGPQLRAAGQAVVLRRDPAVQGVVGDSSGATRSFAGPDDPALRAFVEEWLGRTASG